MALLKDRLTIAVDCDDILAAHAEAFKAVHLVSAWDRDAKVTKADICREIGAHYLIDDLARHCNIVAAAGMKAVLLNTHPRMRNESLLPGVTAYDTMDDVLLHFGVQVE